MPVTVIDPPPHRSLPSAPSVPTLSHETDEMVERLLDEQRSLRGTIMNLEEKTSRPEPVEQDSTPKVEDSMLTTMIRRVEAMEEVMRKDQGPPPAAESVSLAAGLPSAGGAGSLARKPRARVVEDSGECGDLIEELERASENVPETAEAFPRGGAVADASGIQEATRPPVPGAGVQVWHFGGRVRKMLDPEPSPGEVLAGAGDLKYHGSSGRQHHYGRARRYQQYCVREVVQEGLRARESVRERLVRGRLQATGHAERQVLEVEGSPGPVRPVRYAGRAKSVHESCCCRLGGSGEHGARSGVQQVVLKRCGISVVEGVVPRRPSFDWWSALPFGELFTRPAHLTFAYARYASANHRYRGCGQAPQFQAPHPRFMPLISLVAGGCRTSRIYALGRSSSRSGNDCSAEWHMV